LGIRLWISPEMEPIAKYYRLSVVPIDSSGTPSGSVTVLDAPVAWNRFVFVGGEWKVTAEALSANPADVGGQVGLVRIPYWSGGNHWLSGQYHKEGEPLAEPRAAIFGSPGGSPSEQTNGRRYCTAFAAITC
jgi:hypothetical protein